MTLPMEFLASLKGLPGYDEEAFVAVHQNKETVTSIRLNSGKPSGMENLLTRDDAEGLNGRSIMLKGQLPVPWSQYGFYLAERPSFTFDPLFHAGHYYVQEASSMFLEQAFKQLLPLAKPLKVLDLCAAPGGKSTHILSLLSNESLLVSNEVIKQRSIVLTDNIIKWGHSNVIVTNNDPRAFQKVGGYFDVMVVDAPCSGSGLFRKDADAISEWSLNNVQLCSQRQQRILADALPALKEGGLLVYSTCSYSAEEDEAIMDWLVEEMTMENIPLENTWNIVETKSNETASAGYRFYPDKVKGEGFFLACFRKKEPTQTAKAKTVKPVLLSAKERKVVEGWVRMENLAALYFREQMIVFPEGLLQEFLYLQPLLNIQYAGVSIGEIMKEKLVPHHALAQSMVLSPDVPSTGLTYEEAIRYLQRQDLSVHPQSTGWQVVRYKKGILGWINALKNRVNNYYPKEIRILKQNNTAFEK